VKCTACGAELDGPLRNPIYNDKKGLIIDYLGAIVTLDGVELKLTKKEYILLCWFVNHPNQAVSKEELLMFVWKDGRKNDNTQTVTEHIRRLRRKLGTRNYIETRVNKGYTWRVTTS
jgi:DNA-binding response OmpR family regulator